MLRDKKRINVLHQAGSQRCVASILFQVVHYVLLNKICSSDKNISCPRNSAEYSLIVYIGVYFVHCGHQDFYSKGKTASLNVVMTINALNI